MKDLYRSDNWSAVVVWRSEVQLILARHVALRGSHSRANGNLVSVGSLGSES